MNLSPGSETPYATICHSSPNRCRRAWVGVFGCSASRARSCTTTLGVWSATEASAPACRIRCEVTQSRARIFYSKSATYHILRWAHLPTFFCSISLRVGCNRTNYRLSLLSGAARSAPPRPLIDYRSFSPVTRYARLAATRTRDPARGGATVGRCLPAVGACQVWGLGVQHRHRSLDDCPPFSLEIWGCPRTPVFFQVPRTPRL